MESSNEIYVFYGKTICYLFPRIVLSLLLQYIQSSWTGKIFLLYCFQKFPYFFFAVGSWIYHVRYFLYFTFIFFNIYKKDFKETEAAARGVLENFASFRGNQLCWSPFRLVILLKRDFNTRVFLSNLPIFTEHYRTCYRTSANECF